jgi:hypothetical protein
MKKNGIIPPHFEYFLQNECIDITDYKSSNFALPESFDRIIVRFPFSISTLDIQVIFDNLDYSAPPDFIPLNDNFRISYYDIIDSWNFKDSSSLYSSLLKIKEIHSKENEKRLIALNMGDNILTIINFLKMKLNRYSHLKREERVIDILINHKIENTQNIVFSFPADINIRSRSINRQPMINMMIPYYSNFFSLSVKLPHFLDSINIPIEDYNLSQYEDAIYKMEKLVIAHFQTIRTKENIINQIITYNIGYPLEIDTYGFNKFSLYTPYNNKNLILSFAFIGNKIDFQLIDSDKVNVLTQSSLDYGETEKDINKLIQSIASNLIKYLK